MGKTISDLPTDLHYLILSHDEEKIQLKKENEKLKKIVDYFAKYISLSTSRVYVPRNGGESYIYFEEDVSLFGPPSETPDLMTLGDTLFAKIKALKPTVDRRSYMLWTKEDMRDETGYPTSDIWCIEDLRWDLSVYDGSFNAQWNDN